MPKIQNGYKYYKDGKYKETQKWCCQYYGNGCSGRATETAGEFKVTQEHDCEPDPIAERKLEFLNKMKSKMTRRAQPQLVYDEEVKNFEDCAQAVEFRCIKRTLQRVASNGPVPPPIKKGIPEAFEVLNQDKWLSQLQYTGGKLILERITSADGGECLLIWDPALVKSFVDAEMLIFDGTFSSVPPIDIKKNMKKYQLLTMVAIKESNSFPIAWVLMKGRTELLYTQLFDTLLRDFSEFKGNVMTDFEIALRKALKKKLTLATWLACLFHFDQAVEKKAQELGITQKIKDDKDEEAKLILRKIQMLPMLPSHLIISTFEKMVLKLDAYYLKLFDKLITYMRDYWFIERGPSEFCVYRQARRTSNHIESYHSRLKRLLSKRPSIWNLLLELVEIITKTARNIRISRQGGIVSGKNATQTVAKEMQIARLWCELDTGLVLPETFLVRVHRILQKRKRPFKVVDISTDSEDSAVQEDPPIASHSSTFTVDEDTDSRLNGVNLNDQENDDFSFRDVELLGRGTIEDMGEITASSVSSSHHSINDDDSDSGCVPLQNISHNEIPNPKTPFRHVAVPLTSTSTRIASLPLKSSVASTKITSTVSRSPRELKFVDTAEAKTPVVVIPLKLATHFSSSQSAVATPLVTQLPRATSRQQSAIAPYVPPPLIPVTPSFPKIKSTTQVVTQLPDVSTRRSTVTVDVTKDQYAIPLLPLPLTNTHRVSRLPLVTARPPCVSPITPKRLKIHEPPVLSQSSASRKQINSRRVYISPLQQEIMRQYMQQQNSSKSKSPKTNQN